jgi:hypothetical protein
LAGYAIFFLASNDTADWGALGWIRCLLNRLLSYHSRLLIVQLQHLRLSFSVLTVESSMPEHIDMTGQLATA